MRSSKYISAAAVLATVATVFYASLRLFETAEVVSTDGDLTVSPSAFSVRIGSLVAFLTVTMVGIYLIIRLLTRPEPERRDTESDPKDSWRLYLHRFTDPGKDDKTDESR